MSEFLSEAEQLGQDFSNDSQQSGGLEQQAEKDVSQQIQGDSSSGDNSNGGGVMSNLENTGEDAVVNQEVNGFLDKDGVPSAADGAIDSAVDNEANKFM